jgi:hypothetical protein
MLVYVAGAYRARTPGEVLANVGLAADVAVALLRDGHDVICPHTMTAPFEVYGLADEVYVRNGLAQLLRCDAVVLVEGPGLACSLGTRAECEAALEAGIPVFTTLAAFRAASAAQ